MFKRAVQFLTLAAILLTAVPAAGTEYKNEIDVGILSLFWGNFNARYERNLGDYVALAGGAGFSPTGYIFIEHEGVDWKYYNVNGLVRFYPLGGFQRLFFQGEVSGDFHDLEDESTGDTATATLIVPAVLVGWRWVIADRATLTLGAGSGYASVDVYVGDEHIEAEGVRPRFDFNLGFLF
jgi:hypothetical protein